MENIPLNGLEKDNFTIIIIATMSIIAWGSIFFRNLFWRTIYNQLGIVYINYMGKKISNKRKIAFLCVYKLIYAISISLFLTFLVRINGNIDVIKSFFIILLVVSLYIISKNILNRVVFNIIGIYRLYSDISYNYYYNSAFIGVISIFYIFITYSMWNTLNYYYYLLIIGIIFCFFHFKMIFSIFFKNNFGRLNFISYICSMELVLIFFIKQITTLFWYN